MFMSLCTLEWKSHQFPVSVLELVDQQEYNQTPGVELFHTRFGDHWFWVSELGSNSPVCCPAEVKLFWRTLTFVVRRPCLCWSS